MLRRSTRYRGLKVGAELVKVSLFADDTEIHLNDSPNQFKRMFTILEFGSKSGCKVNLSKSCAFYLGVSKRNTVKPYSEKGLLWPATRVKYLGSNLPLNQVEDLFLSSENFSRILHEKSIFYIRLIKA